MNGRIFQDPEAQARYDRMTRPWERPIDAIKQRWEVDAAHEEALEEVAVELRRCRFGPPAPYVHVERRPDRLPDWKEYPAPEPHGDLTTFGEPLRAGQ